jgi:hypothetical protein
MINTLHGVTFSVATAETSEPLPDLLQYIYDVLVECSASFFDYEVYSDQFNSDDGTLV